MIFPVTVFQALSKVFESVSLLLARTNSSRVWLEDLLSCLANKSENMLRVVGCKIYQSVSKEVLVIHYSYYSMYEYM